MSLDAFLEPPATVQTTANSLANVTDTNLRARLEQLVERLHQAQQDYGSGLVFANSLGVEDMLLTGLIAAYQPDISMFVLDTGRLPEETLTLLASVQSKWPHLSVQVFYPDAVALQTWVEQEGINAFYASQELRRACCALRKLEPLRRALQGRSAWLTGLRREQSVTRDQLEYSAWDDTNQLHKLSPLYDWSAAEVWAAVRALKLPYNSLHDKHYPSIGCAPCTRAVTPGEDARSGRWWWENPATRECGLHTATVIATTSNSATT